VPGRKETKLGIRASETAQVHFEDCRVHRDTMLGVDQDTTAGLGDTKKMLYSTRPVVGAQAVGIARAAFEHLFERIKSRELRGTPMASHQHIAFELAEMDMEISASRMLVHRAAWMADHRMENVRAASTAKAHAARTAQYVTTRAMACSATRLCSRDTRWRSGTATRRSTTFSRAPGRSSAVSSPSSSPASMRPNWRRHIRSE